MATASTLCFEQFMEKSLSGARPSGILNSLSGHVSVNYYFSY